MTIDKKHKNVAQNCRISETKLKQYKIELNFFQDEGTRGIFLNLVTNLIYKCYEI